MRLIDADELMEHVYRDRLDSRERIAEMIENAPTCIDQNDTLNRWVKVIISIMVGVLLWATVMLTVETFLRWGIL